MTTDEFVKMKERIVACDTATLWAILRSTSALSERYACELTYTKEELRRRGHAVV